MKFVSLFSGIGGFDLAFERAGMECVAQVEIDKNCLAVLAHHWPNVNRYGDVRNVGKRELGAVDLICGGFPCQDLSVAGRRKGLAGARSGLWFEFHRIVADIKPRWVVIENVPGLLSSCGCSTCGAVRRLLRIHTYLRRKRKINQPCAICHAAGKLLASHRGRDFAVILRGLAECGYGVTWRILDAQYFGLAQRRRRVFIVASLGDGRAAKVLFESEGVCGDSAPSRETGQRVAPPIAGGFDGAGGGNRPGINADTAESLIINAFNGYTGGPDDNDAQANHIVCAHETGKGFWTEGLPGLRGQPGGMPENIVAFSAGQSDKAYGIAADENVTPPLRAGSSRTNQTPTVAYTIQHNDGGNHKRKDRPNGGMYVNETDTALTVGSTDLTAIAQPLRAGRQYSDMGDGQTNVFPSMSGVRRLTPVECERLQGFPDDWTSITGQKAIYSTPNTLGEEAEIIGYKDVVQSDSVRYRQLGNAVAVPVVEWIGRRIVELD